MKIQVVKSPGGITAWLVEEHSVPLIGHALRLRGRQRPGPRWQGGRRNFLAGMLDEGAGELDLQDVPGAHGSDLPCA